MLASICVGALLAIFFIECSLLIGVASTLASLQKATRRSLWIMQHRFSPDRRKEVLIQRYSLKTLQATFQLTLRLGLVLVATALLAWVFEALLFEDSSQLSYLYQWSLLLASLAAGTAYLPLRSRALQRWR